MPFARDVRELCFNPQESLGSAAKVPQVPEGVKPYPVRTQHPGHQFAPARMASENFVGGEGGMQEKSDSEVGSCCSQHRRKKHELVIVYPDQIALLHDLEHLFGESSIDVLIVFPPSRLITQIIRQVM